MISLALAVAILSPSATLQSTNIDSYVQNNLKDASWTARVVTGNQSELRKINSDFGLAYKFDYAKVKIKDPFMLRVESTVEDQTVLAINNGPNLLIVFLALTLQNMKMLSISLGDDRLFSILDC